VVLVALEVVELAVLSMESQELQTLAVAVAVDMEALALLLLAAVASLLSRFRQRTMRRSLAA